jgi:hypothetical protein
MAIYLIDSSILVNVSRNYAPANNWIEQFHAGDLATSFVSAAEMLSGSRNKQQLDHVVKGLSEYIVLWASEAIQRQALVWLQQFRLSHNIGFLDCLIAATAAANDLLLATINDKHFRVIPGLKVERPY